MQARRAQHLHRQEVRQQRAVQQIDAGGAARNIQAPAPVVARRKAALPDAAIADQVGQHRHIAQAEVQALRADRRKGMAGLADQHRAPGAEAMRPHAREIEALHARLHRDGAENRLQALLDGARQALGVERRGRLGIGRLLHPDEAGAVAGQGHLRAGAGLGVKFVGNRFVRQAVGEIQHQGRLRVAPCLHVDSSSGARHGLAPVRRHHKPGGEAGAIIQRKPRHAVLFRDACQQRLDAGDGGLGGQASASTACRWRFGIL